MARESARWVPAGDRGGAATSSSGGGEDDFATPTPPGPPIRRRTEEVSTRVEQIYAFPLRLGRWLHLGQNVVLVGVAAILLLAGLVVVYDTVRELLNAIAAQSMAEAIFYIVENALLALILAELVHTLLVSLDGGPLTPEPFLIIGIVGILRKMLLTTVTAPKVTDGNGLISPLVAELFALGVLTLILGAALALTRSRQTRASERRGA
jgi:uncharacterized membrane protein (DUF373 family)